MLGTKTCYSVLRAATLGRGPEIGMFAYYFKSKEREKPQCEENPEEGHLSQPKGILGFPGGSVVKILPAMQETRV